MSYLGYPNQSSYHGAPLNEQPTPNGYSSPRPNVTTSSYLDPAAYISEARNTQYNSQDYFWSTANQQSYISNNSTGLGQYAGDPYWDRTNSQAYNNQRVHASDIGSNKCQAEIQLYSKSLNQNPKQSSAHALNELSYASGLEPSGIQNTAPTRTVEARKRHRSLLNTESSKPRAEPSSIHGHQSYDNPALPSLYGAQSSYQSHGLAFSAAEALQNVSNSSRAEPASPAMNIHSPYHNEREKLERGREETTVAAEAAEKRKAAEVALKANNAPPPASNAQALPHYVFPTPPQMAAAKTKDCPSDPVEETEAEKEIRLLMARLKDLRGKDSALFRKIWDEQKTNAAKPSSASSATAQQTLPTASQGITLSNDAGSRSAPQASQPDAPQNFDGYTAVIEDNEGLRDLSKFSGVRRSRQSYNARRQQDSPAGAPQQGLLLVSVPAMKQIARATGPLMFNAKATVSPAQVAAPLPPMDKDGMTMPPQAQRTSLAKSVIRYLKAGPRNLTLNIDELEVWDFLDRNPNYIALCQWLEGKDFKFDRARLARSLLETNPGIGISKQGPQPPQSQNVLQTQARTQIPAAIPATCNIPEANEGPPFTNGASSHINPKTSLQRFGNATSLKHRRNTPLVSHVKSRLSVPSSKVPAPTPGSKEHMARKRDFNDLIDLTEEEDEDHIVIEKRPRLQSSSPDPIASFTQLSQTAPQSQSSLVIFSSTTPQSMIPRNVTPLKFDIHAPESLPEEPKPLKSSKVMLAKKLNKAEALRRSYYDPKTVARDILISTGNHPTERPLNAHLASLLGTHIELDSDLSTFQWEDIDPGGPPAPKQPWTNIPAGSPRREKQKLPFGGYDLLAKTDPTDPRSKGQQHKVSEPPVGRPPVDLTKGLASQFHVTATKYIGRFGSGNHMSVQEYQGRPPKKLKGSMPSPLASNADRDQAGSCAADGLRSLAKQTRALFNDSFKTSERRPSSLHQLQATTSKAEPWNLRATPPMKPGPSRPRRDSTVTASSPPNELPPRKGPGRPPRSTSSPQVQVTPSQRSSVRLSQRSESVENSKMEGSCWPSGKRRDRPPDAKNTVSPGERQGSGLSIQVVIPRRRTDDEPPEYPVFKCRWVKCSAELHNISTLRRHITKLHKPDQETIDEFGYICYWKKCSLLRNDDEGNIEPTPIPTEEEWLEHMNEEHIYPLGQKHGDGPSTQHIGKQPFEAVVSKYFYDPYSPHPTDARIISYTDPQAVASDQTSYLADSQGRATTHLARPDDEADAVILTDIHTKNVDHNEAAANAFKNFLKNHGYGKLDLRAAADETLRAMAARKEKIGVGIDRGGCTLVNEERRKTFVQNPGISRVVDEDY